MEPKKRTYLVTDLGIFPEQANGLADGGKNEVLYYTNWPSSFPKYQEYAIGKDFEYLKKVMYFFDHVDSADCIVDFDVHNNDWITHLRKVYPNKSIFGAGKGEILENDRWGLKKILKSAGLKVNHAEKIKGVSNLRKYLETNKDKYVKVNIFRSDVESFYAKDYASVQIIIDELESSFGPAKEDFDFVVEDTIHTDVEIGFDGFFNGVDYLKPYFYGYEYHKGFYIARVSDTLPPALQETMSKLKPVFTRLDYRGALSTEEKIVSKTEHYFLDICSRLAAPLTAIYPQYIKNWAELVYKIGKKESCKVDIDYKYIAALPLSSPHAKEHWLQMDVDNKDRSNIKFRMVTQMKGKYFAVPGLTEVAVIIAAGNSVDEVLAIIKKYAQRIDAFHLDKDVANGIDKIKDIITAGISVGIPF